ncbi:MAG: OmpA family protein [Saprospiraceae bacterium]|nr:OmpA family protein [Saprospiraceae bacterium]
MKVLLWIATVFFFLLSWWWYVCPHKKVCPFGSYAMESNISSEVTPPESDPPPELIVSPLSFDWASDKPITNDLFENYRDSIILQLGETDILEIMGGYFEDEKMNSSVPDLGMARAQQARSLFEDLPDRRIDLKSAMFQREAGSERNRPFLATNFRRIINNESLKEIEGTMIINFPHASDEMLTNVELNAYLDDLVQRLKTTEEKIHLVGHTDSSAGSNRNLALGYKRANAIKNLLIRKGLSADRISTDSKGETAPIASNTSAEGRRQNRRVELTIIP